MGSVMVVDFENVDFLKRNFRGEAEKFNDEGDRYVAIAVPVDRVDYLVKNGFNVKPWNRNAEPEDQIPSLRIKVGFDRMPPNIVVIRGGRKFTIPESEVKMLDWADIERCDLVVRGRVWDDDTGKRSAWLKSMFVTISQSALEAKYEDVPEDGT